MDIFKKILSTAVFHGSSELNRIAYLDGWRGLAIASVLIAHFFPVHSINLGRMGVDIFFVLSGMLMSHILFIKRVPLTTFYKRRISRILPVFIIFVSLICTLSYLLDLSSEHENYFFLITFTRSYFPVSPNIWQTGIPVGHLWSLNVEEHSYIILSLLTLLFFLKQREYIALILIGCLIIVLQYIFHNYPDIAPPNYHLRTEAVASHLFLSAGYSLIKHRIEPFVYSWVPIVTFFTGIFCYSSYAPGYASWVLSPFLFSFTVNHLDKTPAFLKKIFSFSLLRLLGVYSYSIYLWQQPFYYYGGPLKNNYIFGGVALLVAAILTGILSFYFVENPVRKYLNNSW